MVDNNIIIIVKQYITNLNNAGIPLREAFLFGSYARQQAKEDSDIDILLVSDIFDTDDDIVLSKPWSPKYRNDFRIEPIAIGTKRFINDDSSLILEAIRNEGITIL